MTNVKLPKGFLANGMHCGLKRKRKDLALFYSKAKCKCSAVFTTNVVKAAPIVLAQEQLEKTSYIHAVLVNSGNANCMTGERGLKDAKEMVAKAAKALGVPGDAVLVSSTGVIGKPMNLEPIEKALPVLVRGLSRDGLLSASEGIMTTDRFHKISSRSFEVGGKEINMVGVAKGAGMIRPNMATMLCYVLTDANVSHKAMAKAMRKANEVSFNSITVDGDMSTNDTFMLIANGKAGNKLVEETGKPFRDFLKNLKEITLELAKMIVRDGEGATKLIKVEVKGSRSKHEAKKAASSVANSLLVKCAVHGGDPNWGRIAASVGYSGIKFDPALMEIAMDGVVFFKKGKYAAPSEKERTGVFKGEEVLIEVKLHQGNASSAVYACDISKRYIAINSFYTT